METGATSTSYEALQAENLLLREKASRLGQQLAQTAFELAQLKRLVFRFTFDRVVHVVERDTMRTGIAARSLAGYGVS